MAGHFMSRGEVDGVVVGADRIAANGDTANKIGTYTVSVLANEHGMPFYVAAPLSTVDLSGRGRRRHPHRGARRGRGHLVPRRARGARRRPRSTPRLRRHAGGQHHGHRHRGGRAAPAVRPGLAAACAASSRAERGDVSATPFKAMIMAAGLGTRLYPLTGRIAKPMVPILNRPVMEHMLHLLRRHGVRELAANLHYHPDKIRELLRRRLRLRRRPALQPRAGTAGHGRRASEPFREFLGDGTFVVVSGDALTDIDLTAFVAAHRATGGIATLAVKQVDDPSLYGVVVHERRPHHRLPGEAAGRGGALRPLQLRHLRLRAGDLRLRARPARSSTGPRTSSRPCSPPACRSTSGRSRRYWNDVGNIEQYRLSNFDALLGRVKLDVPGREIAPRVWVGEGTQIEPGVRLEPPLLLGAGCLVEAEAELIGPLIVGDGCVIERGAVLEGVIQWDGVKNGRGSRLAGSILGRNVTVHHEAVVHEDAVIGDRSDIAANALVPPGARYEPRSCVGPDDFCAGVARDD